MGYKKLWRILHSPFSIPHFFAHPTCKPSSVLRLNVGVTIISLALPLWRSQAANPPCLHDRAYLALHQAGFSTLEHHYSKLWALTPLFSPLHLDFAVSA